MSCAHKQHVADVAVGFMEDTGKWIATIKIRCADCGEPYRFLGLSAGVSFNRPTVSIDEIELNAPIEPQGQPRLQTRATFEMPQIPIKH